MMLKKTELYEEESLNEEIDAKKTIEDTLRKLQALKERISELRAHFEELQTHSEAKSGMRCDECGHFIEQGEQIEAKNFGQNTHYYHKECFRKLWSQ
jgi:predicted RNase H-like nuclease (RuvC/YqgF family)